MAYVKIWVHAVWGTRNREPVLTREVRLLLFSHIRENAKTKGIYVDFINGYTEHVHCLFTLNTDLGIAKAMQLIKGEASFWANKHNLVKPKLEWAEEYFAVSVSESTLDKVREYIKNQEEHHRKKSFVQEYAELMVRYGFESQG